MAVDHPATALQIIKNCIDNDQDWFVDTSECTDKQKADIDQYGVINAFYLN